MANRPALLQHAALVGLLLLPSMVLAQGGESLGQLPRLRRSAAVVGLPSAEPEARAAELSIRVDGDLSDWSDRARMLPIDTEAQVHEHASGGKWRGPDDLSARIYVAYDASHLYFGAAVRDNDLVGQRDGGRWNEADTIELILDLDREDRAEPAFDEDDIQLFLMPLNPQRTWGVVTFGAGGSAEIGGAGWNGVRVAHEVVEGGYVVEAALPLHNFTALRAGARRLGFGVALNDWDTGADRYQYMTRNGRNAMSPTSTDALDEFEYSGSGPLLDEAASGGGLSGVLDLLPWLGAVGIALVILWFCVRRAPDWLRSYRWLRRAGPVVGVLLLIVGLALPAVWISLRKRSYEERISNVAAMLQRAIPDMEKGTLGSYRGGERDQPLIDLLEGRAVNRKRTVDYVGLVDLPDVRFGRAPARYPGLEGFLIRPYWLPLGLNQAEHFKFDAPLYDGSLYVAIAAPPVSSVFEESRQVRIVRHIRTTEASEESEAVDLDVDPWIELVDHKPGSGLLNSREHLGEEITFVPLTIDPSMPIEALSVTALSGRDMKLVGLTRITEADTDGEPLGLGGASLIGVESELRGGYPTDAGFALGPNQVRRIEIPQASAEAWQKAYVFFKADHPGADRPLPARGARVGEIVVIHSNGKRTAHPLSHQESVFFEPVRYNLESDLPSPRASVAFEWEDEDFEKRLNVVYEVSLDPKNGLVAGLEFKNFAPYPMRFRSVVFASSRPTVRTEPPDSPLEYTDDKLEVKLRDSELAKLAGVSVAVFRNGSRTTDADSGPAATRVTLPRGMLRASADGTLQTRTVAEGDARVYEAFVPLGEENALLGVFAEDLEHGALLRTLHRTGAGLCLLAAPLLLLLLSELLKWLNNLRWRLMSVLTVATLVPLVVLSLVLVRVLESGHEERLRDGVEQSMTTARARLMDEGQKLGQSAKTWLATLRDVVDSTERLDLLTPAGRQRLETTLSDVLSSQRPPDWRGGFLRIELLPPRPPSAEPGAEADSDPALAAANKEAKAGAKKATPKEASGGEAAPAKSPSVAAQSLMVYVGDPELRSAETPLRSEVGFYSSWGRPFLGVRLEQSTKHGDCALSVGRPIDAPLLHGLSPGRGVVLCGLRGYPLAWAGGGAISDAELARGAVQPAIRAQREAGLQEVLEGGAPIVVRRRDSDTATIASYDVIRDLQDTPRALLAVLDRDSTAALPLQLGAVPVRTFFLLVGSLVLLLSFVLSFVVTTRITRPIERLEHGVQAIGSGELDVEIDGEEERGQIGRLTTAFNQMSRDLRSRIQDLHFLNRGMQELTLQLDLDATLRAAIRIGQDHTAADRVVVVLRDNEATRYVLWDERGGETDLGEAPVLASILEAVGPVGVRLPLPEDAGPAEQVALRGHRTALLLPLVAAGRGRGAVLLLFESDRPARVHLELLATMAAQASVAIENARLYLNAVEDPHTGAFVPDHFHRLVERAVSDAGDEPLALLDISVANGDELRERLGGVAHQRLMHRLVELARRTLPASTTLSRAAVHRLQVLVPGVAGSAAHDLLDQFSAGVLSADWQLPGGSVPRLECAVASYPEQAASAEFLFHALDSGEGGIDRRSAERVQSDLDSEGLAARSPEMGRVVRVLERVAPTELTLLLHGETGTGKEVLANLIHRWSTRAPGPLIKVHCAAIPEQLLASELFGHEKGAFTGADGRKIGKFEQANGGTIFLDEIGEIAPEVQVKLLRVLQEREVDRIGGTEPIPIDVRIVTATHRDLRAMVADGSFREDLFYRLQGMTIEVPPLRERRPDMPVLVEAFRREAVEARQTQVAGFAPEVMDELFRRDWPGNIRELRNVVFRAMVLANGSRVELADLAGRASGPRPTQAQAGHAHPAPSPASPADTAPEQPAASRSREPAAGPPEPNPFGARSEPPIVLPTPEPEGPGSAASHPEPVHVLPSTGVAPTAQPLGARGLKDRARKAYDLLLERGELAAQDYARLAGVSPRTALRDLTQLVETGLVERVGVRRGARYRALANSSSSPNSPRSGQKNHM